MESAAGGTQRGSAPRAARQVLDALDALATGPPGTWEQSARGVSGWSVAQQAHHALLVLDVVAARIEELLPGGSRTPGEGRSSRGRMTLVGAAILLLGRIPRGRARAPDSVAPPAAPAPAETLRLLAGVRARWREIASRGGDVARARGRSRHFVLGAMTARQWARFAGVHTRHHLRIAREILAAAPGAQGA